MVLGNIIGSNVLNIAVVMPILGIFSNQNYDASIMTRDLMVMSILTIIFIFIALSFNYKDISANIYRLMGLALVSGYVVYIGLLSGIL